MKKSGKIWLRLAAVALSLVAVYQILMLLVVPGMIERAAMRAADGRYTVKIGRVSVGIFPLSATVRGISVMQNQMQDQGVAPAVARTSSISSALDISLGEIFIADVVKTDDGAFTVKELRLTRPRWRKTGGEMQVRVGRIVYDNVLLSAVEGVDFSTKDGHVRVAIAGAHHLSPDESVRMEIAGLTAELDVAAVSGSLNIGRFAVVPTYSKEDFGHKSWGHKDWTSFALNDIACFDIDYGEKKLSIDSIHIGGGSLASYKNRNIVREEWVKPMPYESLGRIPVPFAVRRLVLGSIDLRYEELKMRGSTPGVITFDALGGEVRGLSNIPSGSHSEWRLRVRPMNASEMIVTMLLPVDSLGRFEIVALLGPTSADAFNPMIVPLANIAVTGGVIDKLDMRIVGDLREASVDMLMLYDSLAVAVLHESHDGHDSPIVLGDHLVESELFTYIVNHMVITKANPMPGQMPRTAQATVERDPLRSPWNYLWQATFAGIKKTIGLGGI
ncbi:MAG: hypothetical protein FWE10_08045 [Rikenellaceae bacterium]|nr:hypothetical protein [Rikenellaceae bacterium]MCL2693362.1 hypothetical protein [Rikenellaceae bacterium]